jgi:hypothetical protein
MTNEIVFLYGCILSGLIVVAYLLYKRTKSELKNAIVIVPSCFGVFAGFKICCWTLDSKINLGQLKDDKLYLVLGGFSVIWISIETIIKCFKE